MASNRHNGAADVTVAQRLADLAAREGAKYGPLLLQQRPGTWRAMMRSDPHYRSYGTLKFLLEHANACEKVGDFRAALAAAEDAIRIYDDAPTLLFDQTRARMVVSKILREIGEIDRAMELARECAATFAEFGQPSFTNMARMFEANVLFSSKRYAEALTIFTDVSTKAEEEGDRVT